MAAPTNQDLYDVLTTALEGGYAEEFEVLDHTRGEDLTIQHAVLRCEEHDVNGVNEWTLNAAELRQGWIRFQEWVKANDPGPREEKRTYLGQQWAEGAEDGWGYMDAIGSDALLQFACFGEIVFG
jgi:hypothetical protein